MKISLSCLNNSFVRDYLDLKKSSFRNPEKALRKMYCYLYKTAIRQTPFGPLSSTFIHHSNLWEDKNEKR